MDDKKAKNFGINPFEDDSNAASGKQFSDDDGDKSEKSKKKTSSAVDEDLKEDKAEVKYKTKKTIKGYKNDVKQYVSKTAAKGQMSELKDSLGEEGVFADKDVAVKKKRKRKRRKKVSVAEKVTEVKAENAPSVGAVSAPESSIFTEVVPEESKIEPEEVVKPAVSSYVEPVKGAQDVQDVQFNPFVEEQKSEVQEPEVLVPEPKESEAVLSEKSVFQEPVQTVTSEIGTFNPFGDGVVDAQPSIDAASPIDVTQKQDEVKAINPFAESSQAQWEEPKWKESVFEEKKHVVDQPVVEEDKVPDENVVTPEVIENRSIEKESGNFSELESEPQKTEASVLSDVEPYRDENYGFFHILEQAGITKGKIFGIFAIFVFVILGIIAAFYIPFGNIFNGGLKSNNVVQNQQNEESSKVALPKKVEKQSVSEPQKESTLEIQNGTQALNMSEILGNEYNYLVLGNDKISGVFFALHLGGEFSGSEHRFSYYMKHLNEMQNLYGEDIYKLLDQSYDRRKTLTDFLNKMKNAIEVGQQIQNEVSKAAENLNAADISLSEQRDIFETEFFTDIKDLRGQDSFNNLEKFVGFSQNALRLRAYYKAYNYIATMYLNSLNKLTPRYKDISVNFEALVKGVHVFDVQGSDINAIIRLSE